MWTLTGPIPQPGPNEVTAVSVIALVTAVAVLVALVWRALNGRRRRHGPPSGYS
jgi:hypothetical protein